MSDSAFPFAVPCVLGWSNPDTGPVSVRLYALDRDEQPRWAEPVARVAEVPLMERGQAREGDRALVVMCGARGNVTDDELRRCVEAVRAAVRDVLDPAADRA
jgi:hypothetical protein